MTEVSMCSSSNSELSPDEERIMIRDIGLSAQANSKEGDTFFMITQRFFLLFPFKIIAFATGYPKLDPKFAPFFLFDYYTRVSFSLENGVCPEFVQIPPPPPKSSMDTNFALFYAHLRLLLGEGEMVDEFWVNNNK